MRTARELGGERRARERGTPQIVEVRWRDAFTVDGWTGNRARGPRNAEVRSVGYVLRRTADSIELVGSWTPEEHMSRTTIPISWASSIVELRP